MILQAGVEMDRFFLARLLMGALSEHEQRSLLVRLLREAPALREEVLPILAPFADEKLEKELSRFEAALAFGADAEAALVSLRETQPEVNLEELVQSSTLDDFFELGECSRRLFSLSVADHLLRRACSAGLDRATRRTRFFMAALVIDGLEILTAAGVLPEYPRVFASLRGRLQKIGTVLRPAPDQAGHGLLLA